MKQGVILILLIATVATVGYALYVYNRTDVTAFVQATRASLGATPSPTRGVTTTPQVTNTPTSTSAITIVMPTPTVGPSRLPNTGVIDAHNLWRDHPATVLFIGLLVTSTVVLWLGRIR